jgi:hypothetical protein
MIADLTVRIGPSDRAQLLEVPAPDDHSLEWAAAADDRRLYAAARLARGDDRGRRRIALLLIPRCDPPEGQLTIVFGSTRSELCEALRDRLGVA